MIFVSVSCLFFILPLDPKLKNDKLHATLEEEEKSSSVVIVVSVHITITPCLPHIPSDHL